MTVYGRIDIAYPYTHSTGPVQGAALAALRDRVVLGADCPACRITVVPAREWCDRCAGATRGMRAVGPSGTVVAAAREHRSLPAAPVDGAFAWVLVRLDGADTDLLHVAYPDASAGERVTPRWRTERRGAITDIERFMPESGPGARAEDEAGAGAGAHAGEEGGAGAGRDTRAAVGAPDVAEAISRATEGPVEVFDRIVSLPFTLSAGVAMSEFYDTIRDRGVITGARCRSCSLVMVPPRTSCARCWAPTDRGVEVSDRGMVATFVVVNVPFHGQEMTLPYVLAHIRLDGADTEILHVLGEVETSAVRTGMRVRAVWGPERTGLLNDDVRHFAPE